MQPFPAVLAAVALSSVVGLSHWTPRVGRTTRIVEEEAVQAAEKATCPVYPFCPE